MKRQLPRLRRVRFLAGAVLLSVAAVASPTPLLAQESAPAWLRSLNRWRANVGLPPVTENSAWTQGLREHSNYLIGLGGLSHQQDPNRAGATADGARAGASSVIVAWNHSGVHNESEAVNEWVRAPFHAIHFFEPRFQRAAYGEARQPGRLPVDGVAALDVTRGVGRKVRIDRPITFPGDETTVPLSEFTGEVPDPLTACPGYVAPTGLALLALFPQPVSGLSAELRADGAVVPSCLIDQQYVNPDGAAQEVVRALLKQKNALVLVPRSPLTPGVTYEAAVNSSAGNVRWSFRVDPSTGPTAGRPINVTSKKSSPSADRSSGS